MKEPEYYCKNGLSPLKAFEKGLLSREEYIGFLKGNIIKYIIRCEEKEDVLGDLKKATTYLYHLSLLFSGERFGLSPSGYEEIFNILKGVEE